MKMTMLIMAKHGCRGRMPKHARFQVLGGFRASQALLDCGFDTVLRDDLARVGAWGGAQS